MSKFIQWLNAKLEATGRSENSIQLIKYLFSIILIIVASIGLTSIIGPGFINDILIDGRSVNHSLLTFIIASVSIGLISLFFLAQRLTSYLDDDRSTPSPSSNLRRAKTKDPRESKLAPQQIDASYGNAIVTRLEAEIGAQSRRATLNLVMGVSAALISIGFLAWLAASASSDILWLIADKYTSASRDFFRMTYFGSFASKIGLSSGSSLFAFFFLSTYRRNLSEIRYFHNELTNVQSKIYAIDSCRDPSTESTRLTILTMIASTERNFILGKGETTVDIAQKSLDQSEASALLAAASSLTKLADDLKILIAKKGA